MGADKAQGGEAYRRNEGGWILFLLLGSFPDFGVYHQVDAKGTACIDQSLSREHQDGFGNFTQWRHEETEVAQNRARTSMNNALTMRQVSEFFMAA